VSESRKSELLVGCQRVLDCSQCLIIKQDPPHKKKEFCISKRVIILSKYVIELLVFDCDLLCSQMSVLGFNLFHYMYVIFTKQTCMQNLSQTVKLTPFVYRMVPILGKCARMVLSINASFFSV
jgi:hypothetical protein